MGQLSGIRLLLVISLYAALNLPYLTTFPPVNNVGDESWRMNIALELLKSGKPVASMFPHTPVGEEVQVTTPWIYNGILSAFFYTFGPAIWVGRFLSFICGAFVIILTYRFGKYFGSPRTGLAASFLLTTSIVFSWHSREIRQEMMLLAFVTLSICLFYMAWKEKKDKFLFLSGFISTISLQVHTNSAIFSLSILLIYIFLYRKNILSKSTILLISGLFAGFVPWLFFNYLPYSLSSFQTVHSKYMPPILKENFFALLGQNILNVPWVFSPTYLKWLAAKYYSSFNVSTTYLTLLLILLALLFGSNRKHLVFLISFIAVPLFISGSVTGGWNWFHHSVFLSLFSIALSVSIFRISDMFKREKLKSIFSALMIIIIAIFGVLDIMTNNIDMMKYDYNDFMERVSANIPEGATVLGASLYYPAFIDKDNRFVGYLFLEGRCPDFADEIRTLKTDYLLMDVNFRISSILWCSDHYYESQIIDFLKANASLEGVIEANYLSRNRIMDSVYLFKINREP